MLDLEKQKSFHEEELKAIQNRKKYELKLEDIVRFLDSFVGNLNDAEVRKKVLDIFVDKIYIYNERMGISFHFNEDIRELSYDDAKKLIETNRRIDEMMDLHEVHGKIDSTLLESLVGVGTGGSSSDFFQ